MLLATVVVTLVAGFCVHWLLPGPRSVTLATTAPGACANIMAQGDSETSGCGVIVNGDKVAKTSDGVNAQSFCLVKSA